MERSTFVLHVQDAVTHLGDHAVLRDHPLASVLLPDVPIDDRGAELAYLLTAAIEQVWSAGSTQPQTLASRRYQYLSLRYCQKMRAAQVARILGLSERQARRVHQEAIDALASTVWTNRRPHRTGIDSAVPLRPASELDTEVARLGAAPSRTGAYITDTLRGAVDTVAPLAHQRAVHFDVDVVPSLPQVAIDRAVLRQVFVNLLVAAVESGARSTSVRAIQSRQDVEVALTIRFRMGADGHPVERVRAGESLRIVRRLIELQAGKLDVASTDPAALVATLRLPVLRPTTVLLVDDNPDTLRLFRRYLAGGAYRTLEATNGRQAIELALQAHPDAVILDVMMPAQDGWETLQALRHNLETDDIPVVVCSVLRQRDLALLLGAAEFLEKPVSREALLAVLQRQLAPSPSFPRPS